MNAAFARGFKGCAALGRNWASFARVGSIITGKRLGHRFRDGWLYRDLDFRLAPGQSLAIAGPNGSGKSTFLRTLAGQLEPTVGEVAWERNGKVIPQANWYRYLSWAGPNLSLAAALTVREAVGLHFRFKKNRLQSPSEVLEAVQLIDDANKPVGALSSGMRQRLQVGLALFSSSEVLLLDEPSSYLDDQNAAAVLALLGEHRAGRTLILASNRPSELVGFDQRLEFGSAHLAAH